MSISEEALRRGSAILADVEEAGKEPGAVESGAVSARAPTLSSSSGRLGYSVGSRPSDFRTARGDEVSISEEALRRGGYSLMWRGLGRSVRPWSRGRLVRMHRRYRHLPEDSGILQDRGLAVSGQLEEAR